MCILSVLSMGLILVSPLFEEFLSFLYDSKISQKVPKIYLLTPVVSFEMMNEEFFFLMFWEYIFNFAVLQGA